MLVWLFACIKGGGDVVGTERAWGGLVVARMGGDGAQG